MTGILAVHAHPDDESITMGATLARYAAMGVPITLVTATLGEQGELMHGHRGGLDAAHADQLGGFRLAELDRAGAALGVLDRRMLGGLGRFRDSGMVGEPSSRHPRAFCRAARGGPDHHDAVAALTDVMAERHPRVVLTYDADGGYGHPDHIAAHQVARAAVTAWNTTRPVAEHIRLCAVVRPEAVLRDALNQLWAGPLPPGYQRPDLAGLGGTVTDDGVDIAVAVGPWRAARRAALAAHATQLDVWPGPVVDGFALTNLYAQPLLNTEYFRVLDGPATPPGARDLFDGL